MQKLQMLIAGGGIGGLAAALAVAQAGWEVRLVERAGEFAEIGAGIQLGPNVTRILLDWRLEDALHDVAAFPQRLQVRSALTGDTLGELPLGAHALRTYGAPYATIHRADMHALLLTAARAQDGVQLLLDHLADNWREENGGVSLSIANQHGLSLHGDALLGADGVRSRVRQRLLGDGPPCDTGHLAHRAMLLTSELPPALAANQITLWLGPKLHAVQYPVRQGEWMNVVIVVEGRLPEGEEAGWDHAADSLALMLDMGQICTPLRDLVLAAETASVNEHPWRLWPLANRPPVASADGMARGRVALLGDAAHPMLPYLAQGAGMAIEDAAELARALTLPALDVPARLQHYAQARWQRASRVQARAIRNGTIFHASGLVRLGRDTSIRLLGQRLLDQPWLYAGGPIPAPASQS